MTTKPTTLCQLATDILTTANGKEKADKSKHAAALWFSARENGNPLPLGESKPPDTPARPEKPELLPPRDMPKRRTGTPEGRLALLHAIAHIELNAVDLHWDIIARFTDTPMPLGFYDDWVKTAAEEAKHYTLLGERLAALGSFYGAMPAHEGMWRAAVNTANDLLGRLAIVPMVLEARGLDVTPGMIEMFKAQGDADTVAVLEVIYAEEVGHVAYGAKWFHFLCGRGEIDPKETFHALVERYFSGGLKPPFNEEKRSEAGLPLDFYWPVAVS